MVNIVIVHFNTPLLTECLIQSINKYTPDCKIYIFDNSDTKPFTYRQDNLVYLDNTKGQIIDFDEWLKQFPSRLTAKGQENRWGSAKHSISIQKCIDIIGENFILLDSDVLLKQDITPLCDDQYMYAAALRANKHHKTRVLPFVCFLNVEEMKRYNIQYHSNRYMLGLNVYKGGDQYDTGSYFYYTVFNFPHREIKAEDWIAHYGGGSYWDWKDPRLEKRYKGKVPERYWLYINRDLFRKNNKKVIYTCITGGYDDLMTPKYINLEYDHICFTDNPKLKSDIWEIRPIPKELKELSLVKQQRMIKILAHKYLPEYDFSIWVDGNIEIKNDLDKIAKTLERPVCIPQHPDSDCIYDEAKRCVEIKKDKNPWPQIEGYKKEGFPSHNGLVQSGIIFRYHNDPYCVRLMEMWAEEVRNGSHRDQLSFNYCLWKLGDNKFDYLVSTLYNSPFFKWGKGHKK